MSIKDDMLDALASNQAMETIEKALLETLQSDDGQDALKKAVDGALLETLQSDDGQDALKKAVEGALQSVDGQTALRKAVQAELEEGLASHAPGLTAAAKTKVGPNQQWLFDTVEKIRKKVGAAT